MSFPTERVIDSLGEDKKKKKIIVESFTSRRQEKENRGETI